jgi:hypothetical protein
MVATARKLDSTRLISAASNARSGREYHKVVITTPMKYLCLAYGDEEDWKQLTRSEQDKLLAQDQLIRDRGNLVAAVGREVVTIKAPGGRSRGKLAGVCGITHPAGGILDHRG